MCGRYRRRSDKQRIAEAFAVCASLEEIYFEPGEDIAPDSVQPVVLLNEDGVRQIELMRWAFRIPKKLLFNARSEDIMQTAFWKDSFEKRRCIVPADAIFEWQDVKKGKKPKYEFVLAGREPFGMAAGSKVWENPKTDKWGGTFAILTRAPNERRQPSHPRITTSLQARATDAYRAPA